MEQGNGCADSEGRKQEMAKRFDLDWWRLVVREMSGLWTVGKKQRMHILSELRSKVRLGER